MRSEYRRDQIKELWARGQRNFSKISKEVGCSQITVKRDLAILRKRMYGTVHKEKRLLAIQETIAAGYESDIAELDDLIQQARIDQNIEVNSTVDETKETGGKNNEPKIRIVSHTRTNKRGIDYRAIAFLLDKKLEARKKLAELYNLLESETQKILIQASAQASVTNAMIAPQITIVKHTAISVPEAEKMPC